jgi:Ca2+-binding RTX toxin-like protein
MIHLLEPRRLLYSTSLANGVLTVFGSVLSDRYEFAVGRSTLTLYPTDGGVAEDPETFQLSAVQKVVIFADRGADLIVLGRLPVPAEVYGGRGNDTLSGGAGADSLFGEGGDDNLFGGDGRDYFVGGTEADTMAGGAQRDTVDYSSRTAPLEIGLGLNSDDGEVNERDNVRTDIEVVLGGSGNDALRTTSGRSVAFYGNAGDDTLDGGSGEDFFDGGAGRDIINGYGGDDTIIANDSEIDTLDGGSGTDTGDFDITDVRNNIP